MATKEDVFKDMLDFLSKDNKKGVLLTAIKGLTFLRHASTVYHQRFISMEISLSEAIDLESLSKLNAEMDDIEETLKTVIAVNEEYNKKFPLLKDNQPQHVLNVPTGNTENIV